MQVTIRAWQQLAHPTARAPAGHALYAIGDAHGEAALLERMHAVIHQEIARSGTEQQTLVRVGDLIDRGPASLQCIDLAMAGLGVETCQEHDLMGNHEQFLRLVLENDARFLGAWHLWRRNGGGEALRSFGLRDLAAIGLPPNQNEAHKRLVNALGPARIDFIRRLKSHVMLDGTNILFVHAGVDPHVKVEHGLDIPWDDIEDASHWAWIRDEFLDFEPEFPEELPLVVHGHTIEEPAMLMHRIGLDSGAHANRVLTAVEIVSDRARFIQVSDQ